MQARSAEMEPWSCPDEPILVFSREAIRELDRAAVRDYGIPGIVLMENAAHQLADEALRMLENRAPPAAISSAADRRALICCGKGNNGGDGLALARHLVNAGIDVEILLTFDPAQAKLSEESAVNWRICKAMSIPAIVLDEADPWGTLEALERADLIVDALLGTGVTSAPRPPADAVIDWINSTGSGAWHAAILSVDIPSGLDCESGRPLGDSVVRADVTVSLVGLKTGFLELDAQPYLGEITIGDIGVPRELAHRLGEVIETELIDRSDLERVGPERDTTVRGDRPPQGKERRSR